MPVAIELLLALIPALLIFAALFAGRYPGERAILRLAASRIEHRDRAPASMAPAPRAPRALIVAGELIARSLATRPPPSPAAA